MEPMGLLGPIGLWLGEILHDRLFSHGREHGGFYRPVRVLALERSGPEEKID
jgi:hypothetical protein